MKIGIVTFYQTDCNYGQLLQCYGLQQFLKGKGDHDVFLIRYEAEEGELYKSPLFAKLLLFSNPKLLFAAVRNKIKYRFDKKKIQKEKKTHPRYFDQFRAENIVVSTDSWQSGQELVIHPPDADIYIAGSDQIWSPRFLTRSHKGKKYYLKPYFLNFGNESTRRIAYAASFGTETVNDDFITEIHPLLKRFDFISVREKSGLAILSKSGITNAQWVPDPSFLLTAEDYRKLYRQHNIQKPTTKYCFFYILDLAHDIDIKKMILWAKRHLLSIVFVSGNLPSSKYANFYPTIYEWLQLIDNAEYVITNSFHGTAFSLIFNKNFAVIPHQADIGQSVSTRIDSLFEMFRIKPRWITNDGFSVLEETIDFVNVAKKLSEIDSWKNSFFDTILNT